MKSPEVDEEVARRVRRVVGFKVMRDLNKVAEGMRRDDQQRPWLLLQLLVLTVVLAILVAIFVRL